MHTLEAVSQAIAANKLNGGDPVTTFRSYGTVSHSHLFSSELDLVDKPTYFMFDLCSPTAILRSERCTPNHIPQENNGNIHSKWRRNR